MKCQSLGLEGAKTLYGRRAALPVNVSPAFSHQSESLKSADLAETLAGFVYAHRRADRSFTRDLPQGYCHIGVFPAHRPGGHWRYFRAFNTVLASRELIEWRIAEKGRRLGRYRQLAPVVWLLIVNDLFLGPGEVFARPEDLRTWQFASGFDKVLLFRRQPGGSGKVLELRLN